MMLSSPRVRLIACWGYRLATTARLIALGLLESGRPGCGPGAAWRPGSRRPLRGTRPDGRRRAGRRRTPRPGRPHLDRPGPPGVCGAASRAAAVGRCCAPPAIWRLRTPGLLAQPYPRHLGTIHAGRRMASGLRRRTPRPGRALEFYDRWLPGTMRRIASITRTYVPECVTRRRPW